MAIDTKPILDAALQVLRSGGVILYPTDTIWGLGCDATNPDAVARIFQIKKRPEAKSLVSVGIRIPMNEFCVDLARKLGRPIVSTSANISGEPSPEVYADIPQEIRDAVDYIVPHKLEKDSTGFASQIIKVEVDGQVQIIRP